MNTKRLTWYTSECIMYRDAAIILNTPDKLSILQYVGY